MSVVLGALVLSATAVASDIPYDDSTIDLGTGGDDGAFAAPIYGGRPVLPGAWADTAGILDGRGDVFCTGTLVAPAVVLTAGHCVDGASPAEVVLRSDGLEGGERLAVKRAIAYPEWERTYDVAVLILDRPAETAPRLIARGCVVDRYLRDGADVAIVGYGVTETDAWNEHKNVVDTTIVDHDCTDLDSFDCLARVSPGGELVAGGHGEDSCYGDSGGPVYLRTEVGDFLVGVTSRGADPWGDCGTGGVYVRPDAVIGWIEETTGVELGAASCDTDSTGLDPNGDPCDGGYHTLIPYETGCSSTGGLAAGALPSMLLLLLRRRRR